MEQSDFHCDVGDLSGFEHPHPQVASCCPGSRCRLGLHHRPPTLFLARQQGLSHALDRRTSRGELFSVIGEVSCCISFAGVASAHSGMKTKANVRNKPSPPPPLCRIPALGVRESFWTPSGRCGLCRALRCGHHAQISTGVCNSLSRPSLQPASLSPHPPCTPRPPLSACRTRCACTTHHRTGSRRTFT